MNNIIPIERYRPQTIPVIKPTVEPSEDNTSSGALLELSGFGVAFGKKIVLSEINLSIPEQGITVLLGPSGTGKSTLLRTLTGLSAASPSCRVWGEAYYRGSPLTEIERPDLVAQSAKLMMSSVLENIVVNLQERHQLTKNMQNELARRLLLRAGLDELCDKLDAPVIDLDLALQRHLSVLRQVVSNPHLLCIDEPTTGLNDAESTRLLTYLREEAQRRALLVVLHNQQHARLLGGNAVLIAGGHVQEQQPIPQIFDQPISHAAREFARTGSCNIASPGTPQKHLDKSATPAKPLPKAALRTTKSQSGPRGFLWLKKSRLAGTPVPGVYFDIEYDLKALQRVGVTRLITLTETPLDQTKLDPFSITSIWEPIPDMEAPSIEQGKRICQQIESLLAAGEVIAVHCRAGLGRTGTILAAYLIWEGQSSLSALEYVRRIEPRWVQSEVQVKFLESFADAI